MDGAMVVDGTMLLFVLNVLIVGFKNVTSALRVLGSRSGCPVKGVMVLYQ
jgi:hypothetical protein